MGQVADALGGFSNHEIYAFQNWLPQWEFDCGKLEFALDRLQVGDTDANIGWALEFI